VSIQLKTKKEIDQMRRAGAIVYEVLHTLKANCKPGVTTKDLDELAANLTIERGAVSAFLNYPGAGANTPPFPGVICASKNEVIVHGIPDNVPLKDGDILSIDYGCSLDGYFADSALTVKIGKVSAEAEKLLSATEDSLMLAIDQCFANNRIGDISNAVQKRVEREGLSVVREFVGHGIGTKMHEPPAIPNFGQPKQGRQLKPGMVLAIEPMITVGSYVTEVLGDGWTAVTADRSLAAHFEHTVAVTEGLPIIVTLP
jgi:methionyl aminopeptidase